MRVLIVAGPGGADDIATGFLQEGHAVRVVGVASGWLAGGRLRRAAEAFRPELIYAAAGGTAALARACAARLGVPCWEADRHSIPPGVVLERFLPPPFVTVSAPLGIIGSTAPELGGTHVEVGTLAPGLVPMVLGSFAVLAFPDRLEPAQLFAAMAAGRAIVAPDRDDARHWLAHERDALLFDPAHGARAAIARLQGDAGLRGRLGVAARGAVERGAVERGELTWRGHARRVMAEHGQGSALDAVEAEP